MGDLGSYHLSDFILFTEDSYYRLFELYNQAIWPLHALAYLLVFFVIYLINKKPAWGGRVIAGILAISWLWIAWAFLYQRFYPIHVVANGYAYGFVVQAVLIAWFGFIKNGFYFVSHARRKNMTGVFLILLSVIVYPLLPLFLNRPIEQAEVVLLAPDPTVLFTLGVLFLHVRMAMLYVLPLVWCIVSVLTLVGMS